MIHRKRILLNFINNTSIQWGINCCFRLIFTKVKHKIQRFSSTILSTVTYFQRPHSVTLQPQSLGPCIGWTKKKKKTCKKHRNCSEMNIFYLYCNCPAGSSDNTVGKKGPKSEIWRSIKNKLCNFFPESWVRLVIKELQENEVNIQRQRN